jgi:hypothetical protein
MRGRRACGAVRLLRRIWAGGGRVSTSLVLLLAVSCGLAVANLYYPQRSTCGSRAHRRCAGLLEHGEWHRDIDRAGAVCRCRLNCSSRWPRRWPTTPAGTGSGHRDDRPADGSPARPDRRRPGGRLQQLASDVRDRRCPGARVGGHPREDAPSRDRAGPAVLWPAAALHCRDVAQRAGVAQAVPSRRAGLRCLQRVLDHGGIPARWVPIPLQRDRHRAVRVTWRRWCWVCSAGRAGGRPRSCATGYRRRCHRYRGLLRAALPRREVSDRPDRRCHRH